MIGRIYVYLIIILLRTIHASFGYFGFKEEEDFPHFKPMSDNHTPGCGLYEPQEHCWQDLQRGSLYIATHKM